MEDDCKFSGERRFRPLEPATLVVRSDTALITNLEKLSASIRPIPETPHQSLTKGVLGVRRHALDGRDLVPKCAAGD